MKRTMTLSLLAALAFGCNCKKGEQVIVSQSAASQPAAEVKPAEVKPAEVKPADKLVITEAGAEIKPPISKDKIPVGAYYCDMGTVHYARAVKGDGECPLCHMDLKQMEAAPAQP
ncbi:hypothetical protein KKF91_01915 [Myxococcota bacterium]|nr:hypothetical protein [Myxococcota bacterium]MBU1429293.1 hypothetical protein [Myxococcota bacterium]